MKSNGQKHRMRQARVKKCGENCKFFHIKNKRINLSNCSIWFQMNRRNDKNIGLREKKKDKTRSLIS